MPDTLCRNCGTELQEQSKCSECKQAIQQVCPRCGYATIEQVHSDCTLGLEMIIPPTKHSQQQLCQHDLK